MTSFMSKLHFFAANFSTASGSSISSINALRLLTTSFIASSFYTTSSFIVSISSSY
jgi:hypothetical protein